MAFFLSVFFFLSSDHMRIKGQHPTSTLLLHCQGIRVIVLLTDDHHNNTTIILYFISYRSQFK